MLSKQAVLFMSGGFDQDQMYTMQVIAIKQGSNLKGLEMCLSDGVIYIGAIFPQNNIVGIKKYSIVRLKAKFDSPTKPILVKQLHLVDNKVKGLVGGQMPSTLNEYLKRQGTKQIELQESKVIKKVKLSLDKNFVIDIERMDIQKVNVDSQIMQISDDQKTEKYPLPKDRKPKMHEVQTNEKTQVFNKTPKNVNEVQKQKIPYMPKNQKIKPPIKSQPSTHNIDICGLYDGMIEWRILGRVNCIQKYKCSNNKDAFSFLITDQKQDIIKCTYYPPIKQPLKQIPLHQNQIYTFSGGEVKIKKNSINADLLFFCEEKNNNKQYEIEFKHQINVLHQPNIKFPFNPKNCLSINQLPSKKQVNKPINIFGIIKSINNRKQSSIPGSKIKYQCMLCDPISKYQVSLNISQNNSHGKLAVGGIYSFYNFYINSKDQLISIKNSYISYFIDESNRKQQFFEIYKKIINLNQKWTEYQYLNLSAPIFKLRTITQILSSFSQDKQKCLYSVINCQIQDITIDNFYEACQNCKFFLVKKQSHLFYCSKCRKMVDNVISCQLSIKFTDESASLKTVIHSNEAEKLIGCHSFKVKQMNKNEIVTYLNLAKYYKYQLKINSSKQENILTHSVVQIQKTLKNHNKIKFQHIKQQNLTDS